MQLNAKICFIEWHFDISVHTGNLKH